MTTAIEGDGRAVKDSGKFAWWKGVQACAGNGELVDVAVDGFSNWRDAPFVDALFTHVAFNLLGFENLACCRVWLSGARAFCLSRARASWGGVL